MTVTSAVTSIGLLATLMLSNFANRRCNAKPTPAAQFDDNDNLIETILTLDKILRRFQTTDNPRRDSTTRAPSAIRDASPDNGDVVNFRRHATSEESRAVDLSSGSNPVSFLTFEVG